MKRNRKYNKKLVQEKLMNGLRHIVLLFGIGLLIAQDSPEEFQFNQSPSQAFYYFDSVTINGVEVESNDWVGAFNGDICVGARQWDTSLCGNGVCDIPVMGQDGWPESSGNMQSGDIPTFKIFDVSENTFYDALASEEIPWVNMGYNNIDNLNGVIFGCTDSNACNYIAEATMDDGSCEYAEENYDCDGFCAVEEDCAGECGGSAIVDECGVCGGDGIPPWACDCNNNVDLGCGCGEAGPSGCDNACGSTLENDECGVCGGDGIADGDCDCAGNVDLGCGCGEAVPSGCDNACGSTLENDECGVCGGDNSTCADCAGVPNGDSWESDCGCVAADNSGDDCDDCAGTPNGDAELDDCGICNGGNADDLGCGCFEPGPSGCDNVCGSTLEDDECGDCGGGNSSCSDCTGVPNGDSWESDCGCVAADNSGDDCDDCAGTPNGDAELDDCGICNGGNADDLGCGCFEPGPSGCDNVCGSTLEDDECGDCGGDNSSCSDCTGIPNGDAIFDCAEVCGGNSVVDNCGVCDSNPSNDNTECWFIDITASVGYLGIIDSFSRIGMHEAAEDDFNADYVPGYNCENCYKDEVNVGFNPPSNWIDFYFPHPEWEEEIPEGFGTTDLRKDIRHFEEYTIADFDNNTSIFVDEQIYYIQQEWDIMIDTDQNISSLPFGEDNVKLEFNFVNQISTSGQYTKIFFYREISGNSIIEEIMQDGGSGDCLSDYCIILDDYDLLSNFKIILGTDTVQPSATIVSPLPNEIFALENENFLIELDMENPSMINSLLLFFEVDGDSSEAISVMGPFIEVELIDVEKNDYYTFLDEKIGDGDFIENVNIFIEIIDVALGMGGGDGYHSEIGPLTFSRKTSTTELESGWHLLSPPLGGPHVLENIFDNLSYDCADGCNIIETANSGTGFYVRSYDNPEFIFTGEVLSEFSTTLEQGWNLTGNPLVNSVDINSVIITYNNTDYNWPDAAKYGIISPTPIIYDSEIGGHIGTSELVTAAGFWVHSFYDDVEISFIPSNSSEDDDESNYWTLSLFAKESGAGSNFDNSIGSEIVIGIHEDANDAFVAGEDQEIFPLSSITILEHYNELSINSNGLSSIYRDIRSYHETSIIWDLEGESVQPFNTDKGVLFKWEFNGNNDPYDYFLNIGDGIPVNMKAVSSAVVSHNHFLEEMSITAELKDKYIGCTHPQAGNYNQMGNGASEESNCESSGGEWDNFAGYCKCANDVCLGGNQAEFCEILSLALPVTFLINPDLLDQAFELPIHLTNPQSLDIEGLQFVLEYDAEFIQLNEVNLSNTLNNYVIFQQNNTTLIPAELSVTVYFNPDPDGSDEIFSGEGEILSLSGNGLSTTEGTTISFTSVQINENVNSFGNECNVTIGIAYYNILGELIYYKNGVPVSDGKIIIGETGSTSNIDTNTTNSDGNFNLESIIGGLNYELTLSKDEYGENLDNYFDGLSAVDASRIARHSVGLFSFSEKEKLAANVNFDYRCEDENGNPTGEDENDCQSPNVWVPIIEAGDAVLVAKYAAGINPHLNQDEDGNEQCDPHWIFIDPNGDLMLDEETCVDNPFALDILTSSINDLVFEGIRLGDVTGNWSAPLGRQNEDYFADNPKVEIEPDEIIKLSIDLPNKVEIEGIDLTIQYDPEVFSLIGYNNRNSILEESTYPTIINQETPGIFKLVSYANSTPIYDNGLLGYIKFKVVSQTTAYSTISMVEMEVNEVPEGGFLIVDGIDSGNISRGFDFQIIAVPNVFALNKNYPNPFNPSTNIQFELPIDGDVKIFIYDLKGSLIDELMNGYMEAGYHQIKWNGSRQASGMYFIQMIADNGNYIKMTKIMLVK